MMRHVTWARFGRSPSFVVAAVIAALAVPATGSAGGWWSDIGLDPTRGRGGENAIVGQRALAQTELTFPTTAAARRAAREDRFFVYLLRGFDYSIVERAFQHDAPPKDWWSIEGATAINTGSVDIRVLDANLVLAQARFRIPAVRPGSYALMFCDAGCRRPLATAVPNSGVTIFGDPATAVAAERIERLRARVAGLHRMLTDVQRKSESRADVSGLERTVARLEERASSAETRANWAIVGALVAALVASVLAFGLFRRRQPDVALLQQSPRVVRRMRIPGSCRAARSVFTPHAPPARRPVTRTSGRAT